MKKKIIKTADGSSSIYLPDWDESYHSKHGAIQEAYHVFIKHGLDLFKANEKVNILEIGFGTGLNCFITFLEALKRNLKIKYDGIEAYPLKAEEILALNYVEKLKATNYSKIFAMLHAVEWEEIQEIYANFKLLKRKILFKDIKDQNKFDLIYFDAFGARVQPELWTEDIFRIMYKSLKDKGILVTYSAKGSVRRVMQQVGFLVEKLPGPPGKREMLRGSKIKN
ncbi:MAG: tRNA (5-methylaminomethyl-2-thiouridine)(34)-methyltransferase MnmD [Flavobacteriaceae bacterium]|nr:tRNA (5-methylaminomethyl-2-thiouridine)(34)-methyltransferase MnmD [Flavobacteriaceae bacterium]